MRDGGGRRRQGRKGLPESAVVVVLLPDTGRNYVSKVFDDDWVLANSGATQEDLKRPYRVFGEGA